MLEYFLGTLLNLTRGTVRTGGVTKSEDILAVRVEMLEQQLAREQDTVEDLRKRLDRAEDRFLALASPQSSEINAQPKSPELNTLRDRFKYLFHGRK